MTDKTLQAMKEALEALRLSDALRVQDSRKVSNAMENLRAAIKAYEEQEPAYKNLDEDWLYSVLRFADKNPDYFHEIKYDEGKYGIDPSDAYGFSRLYTRETTE